MDTLVPVYKPRSWNVIQNILKNHFSDFEKRYDDHYADKYGKYRIIRIKQAVEKFIECGEYSKGIARITCTNPNCFHEYFRPLVASLKGACKSRYLCPSCNQKRIQLFAERLSENLLLKLPHWKFVFTIPKLLRVYFKNDRTLFEEVSKIMFVIVTDFYKEVTHKPLKTGLVVSHQTFGDMLRFNPHWHCIILEAGIDEEDSFYHVPFKNTAQLAEVFRKRVIKLFVDKGLLAPHLHTKYFPGSTPGFQLTTPSRFPPQTERLG